MTNAEAFIYPGELALSFILSILNLPPYALEPGLAMVLSFLLALVIWVWILKICFALIQRALGFDRGRHR